MEIIHLNSPDCVRYPKPRSVSKNGFMKVEQSALVVLAKYFRKGGGKMYTTAESGTPSGSSLFPFSPPLPVHSRSIRPCNTKIDFPPLFLLSSPLLLSWLQSPPLLFSPAALTTGRRLPLPLPPSTPCLSMPNSPTPLSAHLISGCSPLRPFPSPSPPPPFPIEKRPPAPPPPLPLI